MKDNRYSVSRQKWFKQCTFEKCSKVQVKCSKCGYPGHKAFWLDTTSPQQIAGTIYFDVDILIAHAHFVANKDVGRHVIHKVGHKKIMKDFCHQTWTLEPRKLPGHIRDMLNKDDDDDDDDES